MRGCARGECNCQPCELRGLSREMWNGTAEAAEAMIAQRMMDEMHRGVRNETATSASFVGQELTGAGFCRIRGRTALTLDDRGRFSDLPPNMLKPTNAARKKILHNGCSVATIAKFK